MKTPLAAVDGLEVRDDLDEDDSYQDTAANVAVCLSMDEQKRLVRRRGEDDEPDEHACEVRTGRVQQLDLHNSLS